MKLLIATHNAGKIREFERILAPLSVEVSAADFSDIEETGTTFAENALLKAEAACRCTGAPCVADDSGLAVDALGGAPGIYSARYAGENATDADRIRKLLDNLNGVPVPERTARFLCSICCVFPNGDRITAQGICEGSIAFAPQGNDGFGYDPVFLIGEKSFAQLTPEEKDAVSHRGKALRLFAEKLNEYKEQCHADR